MLATSIRSGLAETYHEGSVAVCDASGELIAASGDVDRPYYLRSSAKPFQAAVSRRLAELEPVELALACASHRGQPVHVALVESMLAAGGLTEDDLQCPADWPLAPSAARRLWGQGHSRPRRIWNNCSGKHAAFLRACIARGWPTVGYLASDHPLQREIISFVSELVGHRVEPVGVDGCGAPVLRTTARAMATMFARLGDDPDLDDVYTAMHRYPALVSNNGEGDAVIATAVDAVAKGGAQGCIGVGLRGGVGIAVKSWEGHHDAAVVAAVAAIDLLGLAHGGGLESWRRRPVLGGGVLVGGLEPAVELAKNRPRNL